MTRRLLRIREADRRICQWTRIRVESRESSSYPNPIPLRQTSVLTLHSHLHRLPAPSFTSDLPTEFLCSFLNYPIRADTVHRISRQSVVTVVAIKLTCIFRLEHAVAQLVEALRYKPEGRGFDS
jgi:hypothetical protein